MMARVEDSPFLLTAGGTETYLAFTQGFDMRQMCAFEIFQDQAALTRLEERCLAPILESAARRGFDLLLDTMTWRAQPDWVAALGYPPGDVERFNRLAVERTRDFVTRWTMGRELASSIFINGDIGPRQDGYRVDRVMSVDEARRYHGRQVEVLADAGVDVINALTMTYANEAAGIARAARDAGLPCIISPTIETDGTTPDGAPLGGFVDAVDVATGGSPLFYMVNCAHPIHLEPVLRHARSEGARWLARFGGFRANASRKSHAELDESTQLDRGYPEALSSQLAHLQADFSLRLLGGCCGTDHEHIRHIADAVRETTRQTLP
jgi:S-methylmethionine-dependent homocysteine/selenocysteine methylase